MYSVVVKPWPRAKKYNTAIVIKVLMLKITVNKTTTTTLRLGYVMNKESYIPLVATELPLPLSYI